MVELRFVKSGKEYKVFAGETEVGRMYKDNKKNYQFAVVCQFNFIVQGFVSSVSGKTYKQVKPKAQNLYNDLMRLAHEKGFNIKDNPRYNKLEWK